VAISPGNEASGMIKPEAALPELELPELDDDDDDDDPDDEEEDDPEEEAEAVAVTWPEPAVAVPVLAPPAFWDPEPVRPGPLPAPEVMYFLAPAGMAGRAEESTSQLGAFLAGQPEAPPVSL